MPRGDRKTVRRERPADVPLRRRDHGRHHGGTRTRGVYLGGQPENMDGPPARSGMQGGARDFEHKVRPEKPAGRGRCRGSRGLRGRRPQRTRGDHDDGARTPGAAGRGDTAERRRRHRHRARYAGGVRAGSRGHPDGNAVRAFGGEFRQRRIQETLYRTAGGRHDARAEETQSDTPDPQRLFPCGRGGGEQGCDGRRVTAAAWTRTLETGHLRRRPDGRRTGNRAGSLADPRAADGGTDRPRNRCGIRGRAAGAREASNELQGGNLTIREVFCPVFSESRLGTDQSGRLSCISPSGRHRSARIAARDSRAYSPRNRTAVRTEGQRRTVICPIVMKAAE